MLWRKLRLIALVAFSGGLLLQTTTGCDALIAPILSSIVASAVSGVVGNLFLAT